MSITKNTKSLVDDIYKKLNSHIEKILIQDVAPKIIQEENNIIDLMVYQEYKPALYARRGEVGGLIDENNYSSTINSNDHSIELSVANQTMAHPWITVDSEDGSVVEKSVNAGEYLLPIIERGGKYDFPKAEYAYKKPIRATTVDILKSEKTVEETLKKKLKSRGWNIE